MTEPRLSEAFSLIGELAERLEAVPWHKHPACWECAVDARWTVNVNGHRDERTTTKGTAVPPFECYVEFDGWPAGIISPFGGVIAAGSAANEDALIASLKARLSEQAASTP